MNQDNPFANLGALDQMLYTDTTPKPTVDPARTVVDKQPKENPEETRLLANQQTNKIAKKHNSKPAHLQTSNLVNQQASETPLSTKEKKQYGSPPLCRPGVFRLSLESQTVLSQLQ
jgi:hypothetical protein